MAGKTDTMIRRLDREMQAASGELEFERAARLRDDLAALRRAMEKQAVVFGDGTDADVVAFADDQLEAAVQVFHVRGGRVRGQRGWVVEKTEELTTGDLVHHFCTQVYGDEHGETDVPRELLVPELPPDADALADWLSEHRGSRVTLRVPQRGDKKTLMETVARNAAQALTQHKLKRAADLTTRSKALEEIAEALGMEQAPLRIECFDVSQIQGTDVVASMVVFEDGLARRERVPPVHRPRRPDGAAPTTCRRMSEVLRRRFARYLRGRGRDRRGGRAPTTSARDRAAAQVRVPAAACSSSTAAHRRCRRRRRCSRSSASTDIAVCGLAKRLEEVWLPDDEFPVDPAAHVRGALPAAAGPRRGAPVRHHVPPRAPVEADDRVDARRDPRARARSGARRC